MLNSKIKSQISKYRIVAEIGQGGMSIVYRATDMRLRRDVALKVLHPFLAKNAEGRKRLEREAQIAAKLQHPNILQIYDYFGENDDPDNQDFFIVTELILGNTLKEFTDLYSIHVIPELGALIIREIAYALQHAHSSGVIHRDIKPENIMIREDGVLKLMDFGIAQIKQLESLTVSGTLLGSPAHMAPESIEGKICDHRADIFSLTTVMYWLLTGKMPFDEKSPHAILKAIVDGRFMPPQQISAKISDPLNEIILRGMEVDPKKRFNSAEDMADAITEALNQFGITKSSSELKQILADPKIQISEFNKQIIATFFKQISEKQQKKQTVKVMALLGRVLATEPRNSKALRLLSAYEPKSKFNFWPTFIAILALTCTVPIYFLFLSRNKTKKLIPSVTIISSNNPNLNSDIYDNVPIENPETNKPP
ncbi:MAG: serine/threonine-protein kinase, partial [bacterium]|nr:serine/threonine-protein kinase [bacterium]